MNKIAKVLSVGDVVYSAETGGGDEGDEALH